MDFRFTDEQRMIRDTAAAFLAEISDSAAIRRAMETETGYEPQVWERVCQEMFFQSIHIPEAYGGLGLGFIELVAVLEEMGQRLLCAPFFSTVCLGVNAFLVAANEQQKEQYLTQLAKGLATATLAYSGVFGGWGAEAVTASYRKDGHDYILDGEYLYVVDGHTADVLVVAARSPDTAGNEGISLFALPASTKGVRSIPLTTMDQTRRFANLQFDSVRVSATERLGEDGKMGQALSKILDLASIAMAAEQMGGAQKVLDMTVSYTQERVQFNRPIASFQAVKHKAADMMLRSEVARSAIYYAGCIAQEALLGGALGTELEEAASVAKAYCSDAYILNSSEALQLHGGVGFTWEYDVHLYFKRAKAAEQFLGVSAYHRERLAKLLLDSKV